MNILSSNNLNPKSIFRFFEKDKSILGVDIGTSSLKIVQARKEKERAVLETYGELSTAAYGSGEAGRAALLMDEKVSEMIVDLRKEAGVTAKRAIVSVPLRYSFITVMDMPELSDKDLAEAVPYEARRYIPIPIAEVALSWSRIQTEEGGENQQKPKTTVLLVAVQREIGEKYHRIIEGAGLEYAGSQVEVFASSRLSGTRLHQVHVCIDIGAVSTKISIVDSGVVRAVHNVDRASQQLSIAISQSLGVDFKRAETMKQELGMVQRPEAAGIRHTISPLLDAIFDEVDRLRSDYRRKTGKVIDKAVLLGGGSLMPGLLDYAIERLGIEVLLANPFNQFEYPVFLQQKLKSISPIFGVSASLTLWGLHDQ
ncbi:MAG: type IV pilus assembly protein PilM [Patescibacteria group bacterium]